MKKYIYRIGMVIFFLIGLFIVLYPEISDRWNQYRVNLLMSNYDSEVEKIDPKIYEKEKKKIRKYNKTLTGAIVLDAFSVTEEIHDEKYESMLNISGDGVMGYVDVPSVNIRLPIYHYSFESVLEKGVGHLYGSSIPIGGKGTHATLTAHRGLPSVKLFTDLDSVVEGDLFYIHVLDEVLAYEVDKIAVVLPEETESLSIFEDKDLVTLVTCTPYGVNSHRLLVTGHRVPYTEKASEASIARQLEKKRPIILIQFLCIVGGLLLAAVLVKIVGFIQKRGSRK